MDLSANADSTRARLDKWLWAARFFKTRSKARDAVVGGKVHVNGARTKAGHALGVGDALRITKAGQVFDIVVCDLSEQRGPADRAQILYAETQASREKRAHEAAQRKAAHLSTPIPQGRPSKKDRRALLRHKRGER